jgi:hypothetical protein
MATEIARYASSSEELWEAMRRYSNLFYVRGSLSYHRGIGDLSVWEYTFCIPAESLILSAAVTKDFIRPRKAFGIVHHFRFRNETSNIYLEPENWDLRDWPPSQYDSNGHRMM